MRNYDFRKLINAIGLILYVVVPWQIELLYVTGKIHVACRSINSV